MFKMFILFQMQYLPITTNNHKNYRQEISEFIEAKLSKIQGVFKDFWRLSYSFQGVKVYEKAWFKC